MNWPETLIPWNRKQMETMKTALGRYGQILQTKPHTPPIDAEMKYVGNLRSKLKQTIDKCEDDGEMISPQFFMDDYKFLCDLLHKYHSALKQEYRERRNFATVEGELFYEEAELELLTALLQSNIFMDIDSVPGSRRKLLTDSLYTQPEQLKKRDSSTKSVTNVFQNIQNNYGQAIANNPGVINLTHHPEVTNLLKELITKVLELDISDEEKSEYVADLEILKAESSKKSLDKALFKLKMPTLETLSSYAQIGSFVQQILPVIQSFVSGTPIL